MKKTILLSLILISGIFLGCSISNPTNLEDTNATSNEFNGIEITEEIDEEYTIDQEEILDQEETNADSSDSETNTSVSSVENLAKCLGEKGAKMYGLKTCGYCLKQEEMFGENFKHINYINCQEQPEACGAAGISGVPAWEFADGSRKSGLQSFEALASMAGCEYSS